MLLKDADASFEGQRATVRQHLLLQDIPPSVSAGFVSMLPPSRFASLAYRKRGKRPYLQPRGGFALWEHQRELTLALAASGADFIPLTIDSHTRQNDYDRAASLLKKSIIERKNLLNGYPLLAHGVLSTRLLFENVEKPVSLRHGTPDARVLVEAALDAGITEIEGGGLCYCLPYSRAYPIDRAILNWQYVDRLCALLSSPDRPIHRESFGALTATMVPPFLVVAIEILELLLAVQQGVRSFAVSFSQTGSMVQDLATSQALRDVAAIKLAQMGFSETEVRLVFHQWMGAFPRERIYAEALITQGAVIATLCGADKVVVKTRTEALGIPDAQSNADAVAMTRYAMDLCAGVTFSDDEMREEADAIAAAASYVIDAVIGIANAPLWDCIARSVRAGFLDIPFAPHQENKNQLWTVRDSNRNIRVADAGCVPLPEFFRIREKKKIGMRLGETSLDAILKDILLMVRS